MNDEPKEEKGAERYTEFRAPVTGWEFMLRIWWAIVILIGVVIFVILKDSIPVSWQYGYWTGVAVFAVVYWFLGLPEGWGLDTTEMQEGHIGLVPLNRWQLDRVTAKPGIMMMRSDEGPVALIGHRLFALDEEGKVKMYPEVEVKTNSEVARRVASSQEQIIEEYLVLKAVPEVESSRKFVEVYQAWRKKARLDPELTDSERSLESVD